ncbi:hypothetical protein RJ639_021592, partial [Escallonia herrerae]
MKMWPSNSKLKWSSSSTTTTSSILVLLILSPLILIPVIACTFGHGRSWVSLSSQLTLMPSSYAGEAKSPLDFSKLKASFQQKLLDQDTDDLQPPSAEENKEKRMHDLSSNGSFANAQKVLLKRYSRLQRLEASLAKARNAIKEAAQNRNMASSHEDPAYIPQGPVYRNANAFHRSYLAMEKLFKIYTYEEGQLLMFHNGPCKSIYSTEGRFMHEMEKGNFFRTKDPDEALVYFLPFSVVQMVRYLYVPGAHEYHAVGRAVSDYIDTIAGTHPFWNQSLNTDHFMLSCHDWGPHTTSCVPLLFNNSIRVLCNANTSEGFNPSKDVPLPEINLKTGEITGLVGGPSPSRRSILAFFAGRLHGHIRQLLLDQWKGKDQDMQAYDSLPNGLSYNAMLKNSRFCLCPSGYEVASPRVVEAIYAECIPVLISDGYVPPFSDVLNWKAFSFV